MPDRRKHRGAHPADRQLFGPGSIAGLQAATVEMSWLLTRGYPGAATLELVGNRHGLDRRQRSAVQRCSCSDAQRDDRLARRVDPEDLHGTEVHLDGFNVLTTIEVALGGGVILHARDTCYRDMASMHGTYRKVEETVPALQLVGGFMQSSGVRHVIWYLDRPVANSGRLRAVLRHQQPSGMSWDIEVVPDPDRILVAVDGVVATADSGVLDSAGRWVNLVRAVVETHVRGAWILDLSGPEQPGGFFPAVRL